MIHGRGISIAPLPILNTAFLLSENVTGFNEQYFPNNDIWRISSSVSIKMKIKCTW